MKNVIIVIITILGFLFPSALIRAIRAESDEKAAKFKDLSCICFGVIVLLMSMLINS